MQVVHRLATVVTGVDHGPVATLRDAFLPGDLGHEEQRLPEQPVTPVTRGIERSDVLSRNNKDVQRGLWIDVPEGQEALALVDEVGRNRAGGDLAKQAVGVAHAMRLTAASRRTSTPSPNDMEVLHSRTHLLRRVRECGI